MSLLETRVCQNPDMLIRDEWLGLQICLGLQIQELRCVPRFLAGFRALNPFT